MDASRSDETVSREWTRRHFVTTSAAGLAAVPLGPVLPSAFGQGLPDLSQRIVINALGGISNPNRRRGGGEDAAVPSSGTRALDARAVRDAVDSGVSATNVTLGYVAGPMDPYEFTVHEIATWNRRVRDNPELLKVWSAADIRRAKTNGQVGIIFGFQNAAMVGENAGRVSTFGDLGVRIIQLTYNVRNQLGDGSMVEENRGLTEFGREVVGRLNESRILVDLSHSGEQTCLDALETTTVPIAITHTGCRAVADLPRNKTDRELRMLADQGGVVGIYFMPFLRLDGQARAVDVVEHLEHALDVCGEDHVGIGTDGGTTQIDDMARFREATRRDVARRQAAGISATGETADVVPMIPDLQGPDQFRKLAALLRERGHSWRVVEKVLGGNFLRLFEEVWGA